MTGPVPFEPATRDRIVAAALEVFVEKGYSGTRVQDIAERAGVTAGALYVHFPNRAKLLAEAITMEGGRILEGLIGQLTVEAGELRFSRALTDQLVSESQLIDRLLVEAFALASRDDESQEVLTTTLRQLDDFIAATVSAAADAGGLHPELAPDALTAFFSSWIMGIIVHRAIARPRPDHDEMLAVAAALLSGLGPN